MKVLLEFLIFQPIQILMRYGASLHNFIAPGFVTLYVFKRDEFINLDIFRLMLLSIAISVPFAYAIYLACANFIRVLDKRYRDNLEGLRIFVLVLWTAIVSIYDGALLIYSFVN